jgi:hypothetical protein
MALRWFPTDQIDQQEAQYVPHNSEFKDSRDADSGIRSDAWVGTYVGKGTFITYQPQPRLDLA